MNATKESLLWRYATKKFDSKRKINDADMEDLTEALRLAPSSYGIQPWKFVVVTDQKTRESLREHSWNQSQITDASHLIVLCAVKNISEKQVNNFVNDIAKTRGVTAESMKGYEDMMLSHIKNMTPQQKTEWAANQVYIALGVLLAVCAQKKIDSCPMEGFDRKKYDDILGLEKMGLESVVLCPVGYRSTDDKYASLKKVRFKKEDVFVFR